MRAHCLASSSHGNCYILEFNVNGVPTRIMVECGIPVSSILSKLNDVSIGIDTIQACLVTHAHKDHCLSAKDINRYGIPIFATTETTNKMGCGIWMRPLDKVTIAPGIIVMPFAVEHDIEGAVGFVIKTKEECVIFVNDHKMWKCNLKNFKPNYVFIECNYDHKVVYAQLTSLKKAINSQVLSQSDYLEAKSKIAQHERNLNAHCSLHGTLYGLRKLNLENCTAIFLMHLSDRYANEYRMKNEVMKETQVLTYVCRKMGGIC